MITRSRGGKAAAGESATADPPKVEAKVEPTSVSSSAASLPVVTKRPYQELKKNLPPKLDAPVVIVILDDDDDDDMVVSVQQQQQQQQQQEEGIEEDATKSVSCAENDPRKRAKTEPGPVIVDDSAAAAPPKPATKLIDSGSNGNKEDDSKPAPALAVGDENLVLRPLVTPDPTRSMIVEQQTTSSSSSSRKKDNSLFWDSDSDSGDEAEDPNAKELLIAKEHEPATTSSPLRVNSEPAPSTTTTTSIQQQAAPIKKETPPITASVLFPDPVNSSHSVAAVPDQVGSHKTGEEPSAGAVDPERKPRSDGKMDTTSSRSDDNSSEISALNLCSSSGLSSSTGGQASGLKKEAYVSAVKPEIKPEPPPAAGKVIIIKPDPVSSSSSSSMLPAIISTICLNDSSDEDDDMLEFLEVRSPFAAQSDLKRERELEKFTSEEDKALQRLLWSLNFGDTLHPHQTMAVRRVAGLPERFPLHQHEAGIKLAPEMKYKMDISLAVLGLHRVAPTRGILLADEMGLGKTIESIAGMILYNGIEEHRTRKQRPSLIVTPNRAVMEQWIEALKRNGVRHNRIHKFGKGMTIDHNRNDFIVMEKSKLQIEMRAIFNGIVDKTFIPKSSSLFPHITREDYRKLCTQYRAAQGKERNTYRKEKELPDDCVRRLVHDMANRMRAQHKEPAFRTVVIDESHFLKNQLAYWGIAGLLLSAHAERAIPMSGTPYNNSVNDLAAAMGYIDVSLPSSRNTFWVSALKSGSTREHVRDALKGWKEDYLVRRTKEETLKHLLGTKTIKRETVEQHPDELFLQEYYENIIVKILKDFRHSLDGASNAYAVQEQKRMYTILMACFSLARMAAIHPMIPGGREFTKRFSPSRCGMVSNEAKKDVCVCCNQSLRPTVQIIREDDEERKEKAKERRRKVRQQNIDDLDQDNLDDEEIDDLEREEGEELVPLPASICDLADSECPHYVHEKCLEGMETLGDSCPRCKDAAKRLHFKRSDGSQAKVYCKNVDAIPGAAPGFTVSSKLSEIVEHVRENIPEEDKVLILSFFKGSLDLLEGIFETDLGIQCCRFDGDLGPTKANEDLATFKTNPEKRILLATVQSGGTGLNIVEANHVLFVDRHFNPFTHAQAMDRCYRLGQKKDVFVHFFDGAGSIDEVMQMLNHYKSQNSKVILADGTELGANSGGNLSYQEVSGLLSRALQGICMSRQYHILKNGKNALIPATHPDLIEAILNNSLESDFRPMIEALHKAQWGAAAEKDPSTAPMSSEVAEAILG